MWNINYEIDDDELTKPINKIFSDKSVGILFQKEEEYFLCYFVKNAEIQDIIRIHTDKKDFYIELGHMDDIVQRDNFISWFNTKGKELFEKKYEKLEQLSYSV